MRVTLSVNSWIIDRSDQPSWSWFGDTEIQPTSWVLCFDGEKASPYQEQLNLTLDGFDFDSRMHTYVKKAIKDRFKEQITLSGLKNVSIRSIKKNSTWRRPYSRWFSRRALIFTRLLCKSVYKLDDTRCMTGLGVLLVSKM